MHVALHTAFHDELQKIANTMVRTQGARRTAPITRSVTRHLLPTSTQLVRDIKSSGSTRRPRPSGRVQEILDRIRSTRPKSSGSHTRPSDRRVSEAERRWRLKPSGKAPAGSTINLEGSAPRTQIRARRTSPSGGRTVPSGGQTVQTPKPPSRLRVRVIKARRKKPAPIIVKDSPKRAASPRKSAPPASSSVKTKKHAKGTDREGKKTEKGRPSLWSTVGKATAVALPSAVAGAAGMDYFKSRRNR